MTIFHLIKFSDINLYDRDYLNRLPSNILHDLDKKMRECAIDILKLISYNNLESYIVDDAVNAIEHYLIGEIDIDILEEAVHSITKDTLRNINEGNTINHKACCCIWQVYYALAEENVAEHAKMSLDIAKEMSDCFTMDFDIYFNDFLKNLLINFEK